MSALRLIEPLPLQRIQSLLNDDIIKVKPIRIQYEDYIIDNESTAEFSPLLFSWQYGEEGAETLAFALDTWGTRASLAAPGSYLKVGTEENHRIVGFSLPLVPQDDKYVYLGFKQGIGEGGKNRWLGRGDKIEDLRTDDTMRELTKKLRQTWHTFFPATLPEPHPKLSGDWLVLARLPLADLDPSASNGRRISLKTLILKSIAQAFVIAEKLRDESLKAAGMAAGTDETSETKNSTAPVMNLPLNQILYGPPGTGKTYHTKARAVGIIEGMTDEEVAATYSREKIRSKFEAYYKAGQVDLVTFHQAFGYEDFVEGIKPLKPTEQGHIIYGIENGLFKRLCKTADANRIDEADDIPLLPTTHITSPKPANFDTLYDSFLEYLKDKKFAKGSSAFVSRQGDRIVTLINLDLEKRTLLFRYLSGNLNERDHPIYKRHIESMYGAYKNLEDIKNLEADSRAGKVNISNSNISLLKFVFNELKKFELANSITSDASTTNHSATRAHTPRFVLIIDEINRGNVANIFGELITLLEDDKRAGRPEALTVKLPYSKEDFTVPDNLYLLGTMNTADRSVEALDTALRRRFSFTEMLPEPSVIRAQVGENGIVEGVDVAQILEVLNSRLEQLLDRDHCLGHALLLRVADLDGLRAAFQRNVLPLLQEYFFGDWGKIGLVLGERFITTADKTATRYPLAKFDSYDSSGPRERPLYRLTPPETWDAAAFQSIYAVA